MSCPIGTATSEEVAAQQANCAVVPIGSSEQHGPHLPVSTDTLIACLIAQRVSRQVNGLLVSPVTVTCSHEHSGFSGSVSVSASTLSAVLKDIVGSLDDQGFRLTVLVNAHGGNYVISNVAQELNTVRPRVLVCPTLHHWTVAASHAGIETPLTADMHAGEIETSILLHALPGVVRADRIEDWDAPDRPLLTTLGMRHYTRNGVIGRPSKANADKGRRLLQRLSELISADVLRVMTMDDVSMR